MVAIIWAPEMILTNFTRLQTLLLWTLLVYKYQSIAYFFLNFFDMFSLIY